MTPEKRNPWMPHGGRSFKLQVPHNPSLAIFASSILLACSHSHIVPVLCSITPHWSRRLRPFWGTHDCLLPRTRTRLLMQQSSQEQ